MTRKLLTLILAVIIIALSSTNCLPETIQAEQDTMPGYQKTSQWWASWVSYAEIAHRYIENIRQEAYRKTPTGQDISTVFEALLAQMYPDPSHDTTSSEATIKLNPTTEITFSLKDFNINRITVKQDNLVREYIFRQPMTLKESYGYQVSDGENFISMTIYTGQSNPALSYYNTATLPTLNRDTTDKLKKKLKPTMTYPGPDPSSQRTVNGYAAMMLNIVYLNTIAPTGSISMADMADHFIANQTFRNTITATFEQLDPQLYDNIIWDAQSAAQQAKKNDPAQQKETVVITRKFTPSSDYLRRLAMGSIRFMFRLAIIAITLTILYGIKEAIFSTRNKAKKAQAETQNDSQTSQQPPIPAIRPQVLAAEKVEKTKEPVQPPPTPKQPPEKKPEPKKEAVTHTIKTEASAGGKITPQGTTSHEHGSTPTFKILADPAYMVLDVQVDEKSVGPRTYYKFPPIKKQHTITAIFVENPHMTQKK